MAGLALYDDLGRVLVSGGQHSLFGKLESVKVLPNSGSNSPELYGAITAQAVSIVEIAAPGRRRLFALAVSSPSAGAVGGEDLGRPTLWSATLDALVAGRAIDMSQEGLVYVDDLADRNPRLIVVSAGNVRGPLQADHLNRSDLEPVEDPGQAWNAITVGAFTELTDLAHDPTFAGWRALAPLGELSPFSRTSVSFKRSWPHKPEIVFEGGNAAVSPSGSEIDTPSALGLLTTRAPRFTGKFLSTMAGTSPATAKAAHMAASISRAYPSLRPEAVRALMVHSARWTNRMLAVTGTGNRQGKVAALRRYGWGVPSIERALRSAADSVTLIVQETIRPYENGRMREMHLHELPWPREVLQDLGNTPVEMRVALSYFVEPNPARRGWVKRFRYASHGLRFDVRGRTESTVEFRQRLNRLAQAEDEERPRIDSDADQWFLGSRERVRGSLHVDIWRGPAAELAARGCVAVYPVTGWWKEDPARDRSELGASYALVISIEAPEVDVDVWTPVATEVGLSVEIATGL